MLSVFLYLELIKKQQKTEFKKCFQFNSLFLIVKSKQQKKKLVTNELSPARFLIRQKAQNKALKKEIQFLKVHLKKYAICLICYLNEYI